MTFSDETCIAAHLIPIVDFEPLVGDEQNSDISGSGCAMLHYGAFGEPDKVTGSVLTVMGLSVPSSTYMPWAQGCV